MKAFPLLALAFAAAVPAALCLTLRPHGAMTSPDPNDEPAENSYCYVCHVNYKKEPLAEQHRTAGVGCADCHGFSDDHSADEDAVIPPDRMFRAEDVNPFCGRCHHPGRTDAPRPARLRGTAIPGMPCTGCHGRHRLDTRCRRWNRVTGELIYTDGTRLSTEGGMGGMGGM